MHLFDSISPAYDVAQLETPEQQEIAQLIIDAKKNGISIESFESNHYVKINCASDKKPWTSLNQLLTFTPITHLRLEKSISNSDLAELLSHTNTNKSIKSLYIGECDNTANGLSDDYLEQLSHNLPNLQSFKIESNTITKLPKAITDNVKELICSCHKIKAIYAPSAISVDCSGSTQLKSIDIPLAKSVNCSSCHQLVEINAPQAKNLNFYECPSLTEINALQAVEIRCNLCFALKKIEAHVVLNLSCSRSPNLEIIKAPVATTIICSECSKLKDIEAPLVEEIDCSYCPLLTDLVALEAKEINGSYCHRLANLEAPKARTVLCIGCIDLKILNAPAVNALYCSGCPGLKTIVADHAEKILCSNCTQLTDIAAPNVKEIDCSYCRELTNVTILKSATKIDCTGCDKLPHEIKERLLKIAYNNSLIEIPTEELLSHINQISKNFHADKGVTWFKEWLNSTLKLKIRDGSNFK